MITENASVLPGDGGWMIDHPADCLDIDGNQLRPAWFRDEEDATSYLSWLAEYGLPVRSGGYLAGNATDEQDHRMVFEGWGVWEADGSACGPVLGDLVRGPEVTLRDDPRLAPDPSRLHQVVVGPAALHLPHD